MINHPPCTLEIYLEGRWQAAATLELLGEQGAGTDAATRITYLVEYALDHLDRHDAAALSATLPVTFDLIRSNAWPAIAVDPKNRSYLIPFALFWSSRCAEGGAIPARTCLR